MFDELTNVATRSHYDSYEKDTSGNYTPAGVNQIKSDVDTLKEVYATDPFRRDLAHRMYRTMRKYYYNFIVA